MPINLLGTTRSVSRTSVPPRTRSSSSQDTSLCRDLPVELWERLLTFLDKPELIAISSTSYYIRSIAVPRLFASLRIWVGHTTSDYPYSEKRYAELAKKSIALLEHLRHPTVVIGSQYTLNELVRRLHIVAGHDVGKKEKRSLSLALMQITEVQEFLWTGNPLPMDVATIIATSYTRLELLQVPRIADEAVIKLSTSNAKLRSFELVDDCLTTCPCDRSAWCIFHEVCDMHSVQRLVESNQTTLRKLAIYGPDPRPRRPRSMAVFPGLNHRIVDLVVGGVIHAPGLKRFLQESTSLESLALLDADSLEVLPCSGDALPRLKDFKVAPCTYSDGVMDLIPLASKIVEFLHFHRNLRRFDFFLLPMAPHYDPDTERDREPLAEYEAWFKGIIDSICTLDNLQALGIGFPRLRLAKTLEALGTLSLRAPSLERCRAFRLEGTGDAPIDVVTTRLRSCTFLALSNRLHCHPMKLLLSPPPLTVEDLVFRHDMRKLEQVVLYDRMFDVYAASASTERGIVIEPWSTGRVRWRTEADFCDQDAHWLMSNRTIRNAYEYFSPRIYDLTVASWY